MKEYPTEIFNDLTLVHFASVRAVVRLEDGRTARLVRWRGKEGPQTARVMFPSGRAATVRTTKIATVQPPEVLP